MINALLGPSLTRVGILSEARDAGGLREVSVCVWRNHAFETMAPLINVFLGYCGLQARFWYSAYDDSLQFSPRQADVHVLWLDASRYRLQDGFEAWLQGRLAALRALSPAPVLAYVTDAPPPQPAADPIPGVLRADSGALAAALGAELYERAEMTVHTGTRLSARALLHAARELGFRYLPCLLQPPLKAIVTDLDGTLYEGVLAEDGAAALHPRPELQRRLRELKEQGLLLALLSKNEPQDVEELFRIRTDFILRPADFAACSISWQGKDQGLRDIAARLNIGMDAMLFLDDNPGELEWVGTHLPEVSTLLAGPDTAAQLEWYPGLYRSATLAEDGLRSADIQANARRRALLCGGEEEYFRALDMTLTALLRPAARLERMTELCGKTNQFVLSLRRYSAAQLQAYLEDPLQAVVAITLEDRLSDSGLIAVVTARRGADECLEIDEICVSCRALGRRIENFMLTRAFMALQDELGSSGRLRLAFTPGPRNAPARTWLEHYTGTALPEGQHRVTGVIRRELADNPWVTWRLRREAAA